MRAAISDQTEASKRVAKQHQGLTQDAHGLGRPVRHLDGGGDRVPVATQQLAHLGAGPTLVKSSLSSGIIMYAPYIRERCTTPSGYSAPDASSSPKHA